MLQKIADGVLVHQSAFMQTNTVVVQGPTGVLLVDAGVQESELACLADDLAELGQPVVAGFSTHPHWDHLLWHAALGTAPRYATVRCAATAEERLSDPAVKVRITTQLMPPEFADHVSLDLLGPVIGLPADATEIPWDGPRVQILEHQAHAAGHAALLIRERGVLVAGDLLSDILVPLLDHMGAADPAQDYLDALLLLEDVAGEVEVGVPGHGSPAGGVELRGRIERDRAYVQATRDGDAPEDPRGP